MTYLYGTLTDEMQSLVYSNKTNSGIFRLPTNRPTPGTLICIATILNHINPGGAQIKRELGKYLRNPAEAEKPSEALNEMAKWKRAHANSAANGCQHATPFEYLDGIMKIVRNVGNHLEDFKFIVAQIRTDPRTSSPNWDFVWESERTIQTALQVHRGRQADRQGEHEGFATSVSTSPGRKTTTDTGTKMVQASTSTLAPVEEADQKMAPEQEGRGLTQEELMKRRAKTFCRYGLNCPRHKEGTCRFNHDPNHPNAVSIKEYPRPPQPRWSFKQCRRHGVCWQWMLGWLCSRWSCR